MSSATRRLGAIVRQLQIAPLSDCVPYSGVVSQLDANVTASTSNEKGKDEYGGMVAAQALKEQGVPVIFTLIGGHVSPIVVGCDRLGIRVVDVRDEATTVFAADAVARITGIPGVAIVTAGPGLTNTITAVKNAQMAQSAVVVLAGATATILRGRGSLQDIDQFELMKPHVKSFTSLSRVADIFPALRAAFALAQDGVPGPVCLEFPLDLLWPRQFLAPQLGFDKPREPLQFNFASITARLQEIYLRRHYDNVYRGAFEPVAALTKQPIVRLDPSSSQASTVAKALLASKRPVILLGSQAVRPDSVKMMVAALEKLGAPVYLSGMGRGLLSKQHPLQMRHKRGNALAKADFVMLLGVPADFRLEYGRHISPKSYFVTVNLCAVTLKKNNDLRNPSVRVHGDSILFLRKLAELVPTSASSSTSSSKWVDWMKTLNALQEKREKEIDEMAAADAVIEVADDSKNFVNPIRLLRTIDSVMSESSVIVADGGDFVGTASYIVRPRSALSWLDPGVFGTLGVGAGFALGVKERFPDKEVWLLYGDGACGWGLSEIDSMVRMKLPCIMVVGNDACWNQMYRDQTRVLQSDVACNLSFCRYDLVAEGLGAKGILIRRESAMREALEEAKRIAASGTPVLVNAFLSRTKFREGSISL